MEDRDEERVIIFHSTPRPTLIGWPISRARCSR
jgi:hypothetical protein